jgi:hypothetical protein
LSKKKQTACMNTTNKKAPQPVRGKLRGAQRGGMIIRAERNYIFDALQQPGKARSSGQFGERNVAYLWSAGEGLYAGRWNVSASSSERNGSLTTGCAPLEIIERDAYLWDTFDRIGKIAKRSCRLACYRLWATLALQRYGIHRSGDEPSILCIESCGAEVIEGYCGDHSQAPRRLSPHLLRQICPQISGTDDFNVDLGFEGNAFIAPVVEGLTGTQPQCLAGGVHSTPIRYDLFECHTPYCPHLWKRVKGFGRFFLLKFRHE